MPSGIPDDAADAVCDLIAGPGADTSILGNPLYLDLLIEEADDDNGTGAVSWGEGTVEVDMTDPLVWPDAADGRAKTAAVITSATNTSGDTITVVAFAFYDDPDPLIGNYRGGGPVDGDTVVVDAGDSLDVVVTLSSPSPDDA